MQNTFKISNRFREQQEKSRKKFLLGAGAILILCSLNFCSAQADDKVNVKVDYVAKLNELGRAGRNENDNAAPYYKRAFELCVSLPAGISSPDLKVWPTELPEDKQTLLRDWLSANSKALDQLALGAKKPYYWPEYQGSSMWNITIPFLSNTKQLVNALCSGARLKAIKGDFNEAFSSLLRCYQFGNHFSGQKVLIEQLVGISIRANAVNVGAQIINKGKPNANLLKDFQEQLLAISAKPNHIIDFTFEKFAIYDIIQRTFTDDGRGGGHIPQSSVEQEKNLPEPVKEFLSQMPEEQKRDWVKMDRRQTTELTDKVFKYMDSIAYKTPAQLHSEGVDANGIVKEMTKTNPLLNMTAPVFVKTLEISFRSKAETDALIVILALLRCRDKEGGYPDGLQQLVSAGYLKELPPDPYSSSSFIYRKKGDGFILYSVGADFVDNGGKHDLKWGTNGGDYVFWPVSHTFIDKGGRKMAITVKSPVFQEGGMIPSKYTCDGKDISPPLKLEGLPEGTKSIALICDDPDAPMKTWVHWVMWNIPGGVKELPENIPPDKILPDGTKQGITDFRRHGYGGPCPPSGTHRYYFKVYAIDANLDLINTATKKDLLKTMEGHILAEGQLMGTYKRQ